MMTASILLATLVLLALVIIFGVTYFIKGWKAAFIITGVAFVLSAVFYAAAIFAITYTM